MQNYVAYYRVSTDKQGLTGLGMDAQREAVSRYVKNSGGIVSEYTEVESGRKTNRPQLMAALAECRRRRAILVIAKLDRLSRNVHFISGLMNSDVEFVAVDMPTANRLTIHILAAVAEHEREMISQRTKAALAAARMRGTKLGNPRYAEALEKARGAIVYARPSDEVMRLMLRWRLEGAVLTEIAFRLNSIGVPTPKGFTWYASTVRAAISRLPESQKPRKNEYPKGGNNDFVISLPPSSPLNGPEPRAIHSVGSAARRSITEGNMTMAELAEAFRMIDAFASVGATHFDITFTDIDGGKCGFRREQTARQLRNSLPHLIPGLTERKQSLIVRPYGEKVRFVQLDDLSSDKIAALSVVSCLILETSPGNHQAWVAISDVEPADAKDFGRRLRKGTGADLTASGATRCAGTGNYKRKYEPSFPDVKILHVAPGRVTTKAQLEALGLVASPEPVFEAPASTYRVSSAGRNWPDYHRCVQGAPMTGDNKPDISRADFFWAMLAAQRGNGIEEIASRLMDLSSKAKENGQHYAQLTAENAMATTDRQRRSRA